MHTLDEQYTSPSMGGPNNKVFPPYIPYGDGHTWKAAYCNRNGSLRASLWERPLGDFSLVIEAEDRAWNSQRIHITWACDSGIWTNPTYYAVTLTWGNTLRACWAELSLGYLTLPAGAPPLDVWLPECPSASTATASTAARSVAA